MHRARLGVAFANVVAVASIVAACTSDPATTAGSGLGEDGGPSTSDAGADLRDVTDAAAAADTATLDADAADAADAAKCTPPGAPTVVFLQKAGGTYTAGPNDARTNVSSILNQATSIPAWAVAPASWTTLMACVVKKFAPFNVKVTDVDPGADAHLEIVFAPGNLTLFGGATSVSPATCTAIPNSVAYVSSNYAEANLDNGCAAVASVVGYSLGLESVTACPDAMSYPQTSCATAGFTNVALACGTTTASACTCQAGNTQNSFARLLAVTGPACL